MADIDPLLVTPAGFSELMLGNSLYDWQAKAVQPIRTFMETGKRQNVVLVTPNGSGKDERVIPAAVYYWLFFNPQGRVVLTTASSNQLETQTLINLNQHWRKFGWNQPVTSPRWSLDTPTGGNALAFVTNDAARVEGYHNRPGQPLLMIVNEAKTFNLWEGIDRCTPNVLLIVSSPGLREGRLYEACTSLSDTFTVVKAGLLDCPHITQEKIDFVIEASGGPDTPVARSTLHGEFMAQADGSSYCLLDQEFEGCISFPPDHRPGFRYGFFDFADGQAENVLCLRDGNKFKIVDAWIDKNEDAVVGRSIVLMRKHGLTHINCGADAAAKSILDKLSGAGFPIHRQNFGAPDKFKVYKSWSAWAWYSACQKIRNREIIIPNDPVFRKQATSRKKGWTPTGLLSVEEKHDMEKRGVKSPDRFDAFVGCAAAVDTRMYDYQDYDVQASNSKHTAALHGMSVGL